ncbi:MAG: quinoprotein dehydrogenase-associated SoxYZ-like carrier [Hyphomicrobiales bacterium]
MIQPRRARPISTLVRLTAIAAFIGFASNCAFANGEADPWPDLAKDIFHGATLRDGSGLVSLDAPTRAEDAAIVPVTMSVSLPAGDTRRLVALTLVIDQNPSPLAGIFKIGPNVKLTSLSTRIRVDTYTNIHVVAELSDGAFYVTQRFVKASGGCSAPMAKDPKEAKVAMGQMKLRQFVKEADPVSGAAPPDERDLQIMLRHPNNSGMQMDQLSRLYIPPLFVADLRVWQGEDLILAMEGGISISEDPNFRFTYRAASAGDFRVEITDSDKHLFKGEFPNKKPQI